MEYTVTKLPEQKRSSQSSVPGAVVGSLARAVESGAGLPGDIISNIPRSLFAYGPEETTLENIRSIESDDRALPMPLPTSDQLRSLTQYLTGNALEPAGPITQRIQDVGSATGKYLPNVATSGLSALQALGMGAGGQAAKGLSQLLGFGETGQNIAELAGEIGAGTIGRGFSGKGIRRSNKARYESLKELSEDGTATAPVKDYLKEAFSEAHKADKRIVNKKTVDEIEDIARTIKNNITDGELNIYNAWQNRKSIAEKGNTISKEAYSYLDKFKDGLNDFIESSGTQNPGFLSTLKEADAIHTWQNMKTVMEKVVGPLTENKMGKFLKPIKVVLDVPEKYLIRGVLSNPIIAREAGKMALASLNDNIPSMAKHAKSINRLLESEPEVMEYTVTRLPQ